MKRSIVISAHGSNSWIGGVYYRKNLLFSLLQNEYIKNKYSFVITTNESTDSVFRMFEDRCIIYKEKVKKNYFDKILKALFYIMNRAEYVFPSDNYSDRHMLLQQIFWIADFQHHYLKKLFTKDDLTQRFERERFIEKSNSPLVLSSYDAKREFERNYNKPNVYVVPFVSYIEDEIRTISKAKESETLAKNGLIPDKYAVIMNQFWQHKNHIIAFEAIKELFTRVPDLKLTIVLSGKMEDYRNPDYIKKLTELANAPQIAPHIKILGFIDRQEQIVLMKNASFVIQPSLFEGWGTVVEDAKVLDKTILLSDIPVHHEQMNEKCILFDPHDPVALADLIYQESQKEHHDDVEKGIADMYKRAKEYSKGFEQLLRDLEK